MNDKEVMKRVLNSYVEDLKEGRQPEVFNLFKENPELAKAVAPLIHITRLNLIKEGKIKFITPDPKESKKLSDNLIHKFKDLQKNQQPHFNTNFKMALAFRKNKESIDFVEEEDYTSKAIEKLRKKMKKSND